MRDGDISSMLEKLPFAKSVARRYSDNLAATIFDVPFEPSPLYANEFGPVLFLKENKFKRGEFAVDVRKCIKREGTGTCTYTSVVCIFRTL